MKTLTEIRYAQAMIFICTFILSLTFLAGCDNDVHSSKLQIDELDFELAVLSEADDEAIAFEHGTDVRIAVKLINSSDKDLEWRYDYICHLLNSPEFLLVYRRDVGNESTQDYVLIGTPYKAPINCLAINYPPQSLPTGENTIAKIPWSSNPDNEPLAVGRYLIRSDFEFEIDGRTRSWAMQLDFEVR